MYDDERFTKRQLGVKLTSEQQTARAQEYVDCDAAIEKLKTEQKAANDRFKRDIGSLVNKKENLGRAVQHGEEFQDVECEWIENFEQNCYELHRLDLPSGDDDRVVDRRAMTAGERQEEIEFEGDEQSDDEQFEGDDEQSENGSEQFTEDDEQFTDDDEQSETDDEFEDPDEPDYEPEEEEKPKRGKKKTASKRGATSGKKKATEKRAAKK